MLSQAHINQLVALALEEDVGSGDLTAGLVAADTQATARVITREDGVLCGTALVNEVFRALDPDLSIVWHCRDGDRIHGNDLPLAEIGSGASSSQLHRFLFVQERFHRFRISFDREDRCFLPDAVFTAGDNRKHLTLVRHA